MGIKFGNTNIFSLFSVSNFVKTWKNLLNVIIFSGFVATLEM